jgi:cytochrome c oxidase subunit I
MQPTTEATLDAADPHGHGPSPGHGDDHGHPSLGFWRTYIFSTDHKVIGIQYALTGLAFLFFGFVLVLLMRWQLAYPERALPILGELVGALVGEEMMGRDPAGRMGLMMPDLYNSFGAMHGTIMVFLAVVPVAFAAFGNYVVPLQIGAPDMAFPRINMASYQSYFLGGVVMMASFFIPGGAAKSGWTSYSPLATVTGLPYLFDGQSFWLIGMVLLITSSLLGSVNFIVTIIQLRAKGMTWMRLPFFVWAMFVTAFLLLLAFPPLEAAGIMQLMDNLLGTSFFLPSGLVISGQALERSGGGSPLLWQHLFWFLAHPEVYVLILPAIGMVCEIIANNTRKPIWGYRLLVYAALAIGFLSFIVWAHHMYLTGMGTKIATFFQTTTIIISIPSVVILTCLFLSLWGGSIRINTPMLFALAFLPMFGIGGLTGLPLGFSYADIQLHDTYYVIAHFHYVVAPGTIFAIFAGIYYWYPKATGRFMNEFWGRVHFWLSLIFMNAVFLPMFAQGLGGLHRRMYDGGVTYAGAADPADGVVGVAQVFVDLNRFITHAAVMLMLAQIPFIINFFVSMKRGRQVESDNPWDATTLEWQTPTPPPHGNFTREIRVYRGPYEYSLPGAEKDFTPQNEPPKERRTVKKPGKRGG